MKTFLKWSSLFASVVALLLLVWIFEPLDLAKALGEYLLPTSVKTVSLACTPISEDPPPDLIKVVDEQRGLYHLRLQSTAVCRSDHSDPAQEGRFSALPRSEQFRIDWKPLSRGCCSARFGRHVIVAVGNSKESGSVIVQAALIESRGDYLNDAWQRFTQKLDRMKGSFSRH